MVIRNYQDLKAWQRAMDLIDAIYAMTRKWPAEELYGLSAQIRRAAVSIASNIAEGQGRRADREFARYLQIAHGSLREVETQVLVGKRQGYCTDEQAKPLLETSAETGRLITGLLNTLSTAKE